MVQSAINELCSLLDSNKSLLKIEILQRDVIILHWTDTEFHKKEFKNSIEMLEWIVKNHSEEW